MRSLVVYDTQFGNTEKLAHVIVARLEQYGRTRLVSVADAAGVSLEDIDLLVIGGPTQGHRARKPLRDWVDALDPKDLKGLAIAAFDTRLSWPMFLSGSAAHTIANILQRHNARLALPPESFIVKESEGPLADDELERAAAWTGTLAAKIESSLLVHTH